MDYMEYLPYAFALIFTIPFWVLLRQFVYVYISLKERELKLISLRGKGIQNLQAYERIILFLERIKPANLVNKFDKNLKIHEFLFLTEKVITEEFDYNTPMQLYISKKSWQNIVTSKNNILQIAYNTYDKMGKDANLEEYKTIFLMNYVNGEDFIAEAIDELRKEALILGR